MKKIIAIILCVLMILVPSAFASESKNSIEVLNALGIGNFENPDKITTRGEFVAAISDVLNYNNKPAGEDGIFSDVSAAHKHSGAIYDAYKRGIISGYPGGAFGADNPILFSQAIKIMVSALGYDNLAKAYGGFPSGYMTIAAQEKLFKGIVKSGDETITQAEASVLIENTMNTPIFNQVVYGDETEWFEKNDDVTMLSYYAKIRMVEGVVTDNGITSLVGDSTTKTGNVIIENNVYNAGNSGAENYLGIKMRAYVIEEDNEEKILYALQAPNVEIIKIPASRILFSDADFSAENIVYEDVYGNKLKAKVDTVADFIFNKKAYPDLKTSDLEFGFGELTLIDNNYNNVYEVVFVEASDIFVASGASENTKVVYKKNGGSLDLSKCKNIEIYRDGVKCGFNNIMEYDTVSAKVSIDKSTVTLNVSSKKVSGMVESVSVGDNIIEVDGKYYHVADESIINKIKISHNYEFCLDADKNIAGIKTMDKFGNYVGIVIDAAIENGVSAAAQVKIFSHLGNFDILNLSDKALIDGDDTKSKSEKINYIKTNMKDKIVSCVIGSKGDIIEISLPYTKKPASHQTEQSLKLDYESESAIRCYGSGGEKNFNGRIAINDKTVVFSLPADRSRLEEYSVRPSTHFQNSATYVLQAYSIGGFDGISDYIINNLQENDNTYYYENRPILVSKLTRVLNADGFTVEQVTGYNEKGEIRVVSKYENVFTNAGVKSGDIIRYKTDDEGRAEKVERVVDGESVKRLVEVNNQIGGSPRLMLYDVYYKYDNLLGITTADLGSPFDDDAVSDGVMIQFVPGHLKIFQVDTKNNNNISQVTRNDIKDYKNFGKERSRIFIFSYSGTEIFIVIYN